MEKDVLIRAENVTMRFILHREKMESLKEYAIRKIKGQIQTEEFYALRDISFEVKKGESFAIVGANGSGKSTLLKIVAGIFAPSSGSIEVNGTIAPLIELGAGFDMDLTAAENIYLNGAVLGYSKKEIVDRYERIVEFSELSGFMDVALKNFSSGMIARLGFSIATLVEPEILICDEILSVGDYAFQAKCMKKMQTLIDNGTTLFFVSHSFGQVRDICKTALYLKKGQQIMLGSCDEVCNLYLSDSEEVGK